MARRCSEKRCRAIVYTVLDTYLKHSDEREIHIRYNRNNENDRLILEKMRAIILEEQPLCSNCINYYKAGCLGGYLCASCKIHGNLEAWDNPHHDGDGGKCREYCRRTKTAEELARAAERAERYAHLAKYQEKLNALKEVNNEK